MCSFAPDDTASPGRQQCWPTPNPKKTDPIPKFHDDMDTVVRSVKLFLDADIFFGIEGIEIVETI